jgi:putative SOS response-associated peptidase YedK
MCGRYATTRSSGDLSALFEALDESGAALAPDYNVAPTDPVPIVRISQRLAGPQVLPEPGGQAEAAPDGGRALSVARWGLVPPWARDPKIGARMINARAETIATSKAFAPSFARRRCLIPADGWYEWLKPAGGRGGKRAYFMTARDGQVLALAGLWTVWSIPQPTSDPIGADGGRLMTCSVVTTAAVGELTRVHNRMPLLLPRQRWVAWLGGVGENGTTDRPSVEDLLAPPSEEFLAGLEIRPVGAAVGDVRNDGPSLIARVDEKADDGVIDFSQNPTLF